MFSFIVTTLFPKKYWDLVQFIFLLLFLLFPLFVLLGFVFYLLSDLVF